MSTNSVNVNISVQISNFSIQVFIFYFMCIQAQFIESSISNILSIGIRSNVVIRCRIYNMDCLYGVDYYCFRSQRARLECGISWVGVSIWFYQVVGLCSPIFCYHSIYIIFFYFHSAVLAILLKFLHSVQMVFYLSLIFLS